MGTRFPPEKKMKCVICKHGETQPGIATVTLQRGAVTLVLKSVPAQICDNCGEQYIDAQTTSNLLKQAEQAVESGVEVEVRAYAA